MKPIILATAVLLLALAACGEDTPPAPVTPPPPKFASNWYAADGPTPGVTVNIHETALGLAGLMQQADGELHPIRNIVLNSATMSFTVPALGTSWTASPTTDGSWAGKWTEDGKTTDLILKPASPLDMTGKLVTLEDGRWMQVTCAGTGSPTVLLDYGAGGTMAVWKDVFEPIATTTRTCMFERAARGLSDPGRMPRDVNTVVADMDALIRAARIDVPVVLVGHSMASYHVRQFANLHTPGIVAGIVLIDPSGDGQTARFTEFIPNLKELLPERVDETGIAKCAVALRGKLVSRDDPVAVKCGGNDPDRVEATLSEMAAMEVVSTGQLVTARKLYGEMPLIVLTRSDYDKGMPPEFTAQNRTAMAKVWSQMHDEMTVLSSAGQHRVIKGAGHFIQGDQPQAVIDAVNEVVATARAKPQ
jgi:pimeloyl-ACP methyl ester carboxylesterase